MIDLLKKLNFIINNRQKNGLIILFFLLIGGMFLEVLGLGVLLPVMNTILDPEQINNDPILFWFKEQFKFQRDIFFIFFLLLSLVLVYVIKSSFLIYLSYRQNRFLSNLVASTSNKLFKKYLSKSYSFHLEKNSSELIKNIQIEITLFNKFLTSIMTSFVEASFVISVVLTLVFIEPYGTLLVGISYGMLTLLILKITKRKLKIWGKLRQKVDSEIAKVALESFGGIKDLILLGRASFFNVIFSKSNFERANLNTKQTTISQIPRFLLELITILGLVSFIVVMILNGKDSTKLISTLGVFVAASFRIIPSLNRIIISSQSIKYYEPSVNLIYNEIKDPDLEKLVEFDIKDFYFKDKICVKKLGFSFEDGTNIFNELSFQIKKGDMVGIIGKSGIGKSTLVDLLMGLYKPTLGEISIDSIKDFQLSKSWKKQIGYVSQDIFLMDDSIRKNIAFGIQEDEIDDEKLSEIVKKSQLDEFVLNLKNGLETKVGERGVQISGGQKQRIGIARALYNNPEVLIFDEATSALDSTTEKDIINTINVFKGKKTIIMIAHRKSTLKECDFIYEIQNKKIVKTS